MYGVHISYVGKLILIVKVEEQKFVVEDVAGDT